MNKKRKKIYKNLKEGEEKWLNYQKNFVGGGIDKILKRLGKYKIKYINYLLTQLTGKSKRVGAELFFGEKLKCFIPEALDFYLAGILKPEINELKVTKFLIKHLPEETVFFDIGAHCGFYTLLADKLIEDGEIHSFEPSKNIFKLLKENTKDKKDIYLNNIALSDKEGEITFYEMKARHSQTSTIDIESSKKIKDIDPQDYKKKKIKASTFDKYCKKENVEPDFVKIDVEGSEEKVVKGGIKTIEKYKPTILLEVWGPPLDFDPHLKAIETLKDLNYTPHKIKESGEIEKIKQINPKKDIKDHPSDNFIFKP